MTINTGGYNIKPMLRFVAVPVVIFISFFGTIMTSQCVWPGYFARTDGTIDSIASLVSIGIKGFHSQIFFCLSNFTFLTLSVSFLALFTVVSFSVLIIAKIMKFFAFWGFLPRYYIRLDAVFAPIAKIIRRTFIFIKIINRFCFLAVRAIFRYDFDSHNCFSIKQLWLKPLIASHILVSGLFYYNVSTRLIK